MPTDSDPVPDFPRVGVCADAIDHAGDFVPGRSRIDDPREDAFLGEHVAMAHAARLDLDPDETGRRLLRWTIDHFEISTRAIYPNCFHTQAPAKKLCPSIIARLAQPVTFSRVAAFYRVS
jgi:hypothetical protein